MAASQGKPPHVDGIDVSFPAEHVMLLTINRAKQMNSINHLMNWQVSALMSWYDNNPDLRCAIITGMGNKAFCAGSDLLEIERTQKDLLEGRDVREAETWLHEHPKGGFCGLSRRRGKKPLIAAVNGVALGGGFEIVLNSDIAIASPNAQFGLPEATVGVYAYGGGLPRLVRNLGMQAASDIALTGRRVSAKEALELHLVQGISDSPLDIAMEKAKQIAAISPDGIAVTRAALREAWENGSVERSFQTVHDGMFEDLLKSENSLEGLKAFREKRKPKWRQSKL